MQDENKTLASFQPAKNFMQVTVTFKAIGGMNRNDNNDENSILSWNTNDYIEYISNLPLFDSQQELIRLFHKYGFGSIFKTYLKDENEFEIICISNDYHVDDKSIAIVKHLATRYSTAINITNKQQEQPQKPEHKQEYKQDHKQNQEQHQEYGQKDKQQQIEQNQNTTTQKQHEQHQNKFANEEKTSQITEKKKSPRF